MKCGLYVHDDNPLITALQAGFRIEGIEARIHDCICRDSLDESEDLIVIHPTRTFNEEHCYGKIKKAVKQNPQKRFYVFAFERPERKEAIGEHPNLKYLTNRENIRVILTEIVDLAREE